LQLRQYMHLPLAEKSSCYAQVLGLSEMQLGLLPVQKKTTHQYTKNGELTISIRSIFSIIVVCMLHATYFTFSVIVQFIGKMPLFNVSSKYQVSIDTK